MVLCAVIPAMVSCAGMAENPVVAHRGAWKNTGFPQNSLASLDAAIKMGCAGSEFDIHLTSDDTLVVFHDLTFKGHVIDSTSYCDLMAAGTLSNGEKIPTAREYLAAGLSQDRTKLIIDIKTPKNKERSVEAAVAIDRIIEELGASDRVEYLAGYVPAVKKLLEISDVPVAYLGEYSREVKEMDPSYIIGAGIKNIDYRYMYLQKHPEWTDTFRENGVRLNAWVVNDREDMEWFLEKKYDYITTDEPEKLLSLVSEIKR